MINNYITYSGHQIGVSHIDKGLQCEDFSANYIDERIAIAVISDGHGDKNCFRSAKGAEIACTIAIEKVNEVLCDTDAIIELKSSPDRIITELEKCIIHSWNQCVLDDARIHPFTDIEYQGLDDNVVLTLKSGQKHQKVYGCTLIMCVFVEGFWFGIQIGDGKCIACASNGLYSQPIPADNEGCVGNRSTSICNSNAFDSFRYYYGTDIPVAVFVASDGVDESFDENGLNKCYYTISSWLKTLNENDYRNNIDELLRKISKGGSGDDVSIACIVSRKEEVKKPFATSQQVALKMDELFSILQEAEKRYIELSEQKREADEGKCKLEKEVLDLEKLLNDKKIAYEEKCCELDSVKRNIDTISEQLQLLSNQFINAKETKKKVDEYWIQLGVEICDNSEVMNYQPISIDDRNIVDSNDENKSVHGLSNEKDINTNEKQDTPPKKEYESNNDEKYIDKECIITESVEEKHHDDVQIILADKSVEEVKKNGFFGNLFKKK